MPVFATGLCGRKYQHEASDEAEDDQCESSDEELQGLMPDASGEVRVNKEKAKRC